MSRHVFQFQQSSTLQVVQSLYPNLGKWDFHKWDFKETDSTNISTEREGMDCEFKLWLLMVSCVANLSIPKYMTGLEAHTTDTSNLAHITHEHK